MIRAAKPSPLGKGDRRQAVDEGRGAVATIGSAVLLSVLPCPHPTSLRSATFPQGKALWKELFCFSFFFSPALSQPSSRPSPPGKGDRRQAVDEGRGAAASIWNADLIAVLPCPHPTSLRSATFPLGKAFRKETEHASIYFYSH